MIMIKGPVLGYEQVRAAGHAHELARQVEATPRCSAAQLSRGEMHGLTDRHAIV